MLSDVIKRIILIDELTYNVKIRFLNVHPTLKKIFYFELMIYNSF